jgi:hypothetical protein
MELRESADAAGRCRPAALAALGLLRERGLEAELVRLGLDRKNEHHWIAVVGDIAIDPSARQFEAHADAPVPRVAPFAEYESEWPEQQVLNPASPWDMKRFGVDWVPPWATAQHGLPPRPPGLDEVWPTS